MKRIYFDYAATTPVLPEVKAAMEPYSDQNFGNSASLHWYGQQALAAVDQARQILAQIIEADKTDRIIFTASATESNNMALYGLVLAHKNNDDSLESACTRRSLVNKQLPHLITSAIEHPSVLEPCRSLERLGLASLTIIKPQPNGLVLIDDILSAIKPETKLISLHAINSELGTIQAVTELAQRLKKINSHKDEQIYLHVDAAQALIEKESLVDRDIHLLTLSSHKHYGPKGAAALVVRSGLQLEPLLTGGLQEDGWRGGTQNVGAIVGFASAYKYLAERRMEISQHLHSSHDLFLQELINKLVVFEINGQRNLASPKIINIYFPWVEAAELLVALDQVGLAVAAGVACQARANLPSSVVLALTGDQERAKRSLRISFGLMTTKADINKLVEALTDISGRYNKK